MAEDNMVGTALNEKGRSSGAEEDEDQDNCKRVTGCDQMITAINWWCFWMNSSSHLLSGSTSNTYGVNMWRWSICKCGRQDCKERVDFQYAKMRWLSAKCTHPLVQNEVLSQIHIWYVIFGVKMAICKRSGVMCISTKNIEMHCPFDKMNSTIGFSEKR